MSTEQLAEALRGMLALDEDHQRGACDDDVCAEVRAARAALAAHEAEKAQAAGSVDCIGLALELEFQSKLVESLATERAMRAAVHGLRLLAGGVAPVAPVAMWQFRHVTEEAWRELVPRTGQTLEVAIAELLGYRVGTRRVYQVRPLFAGPAAPASASEAPVAVPNPESAPVWSEKERRIGGVLFAAWAKAEPSHSVTMSPVSYRATFCDMARAVLQEPDAPAAPVAVPVLVRDVADMLGTTVAAVSAAFVALGHAPRSTNMAVTGEEAVQVAAHLRAAPAAPVAVPLTDEWIRERCKQSWVFETVKQWVRAVELAHGIGKEGGEG